MKQLVDPNADAGESLGRGKRGHDAELMAHVTSVTWPAAPTPATR